MLTTEAVSITKFNNHYHVVSSKLVIITMYCSDVHYTIFTVQAQASLAYHTWVIPPEIRLISGRVARAYIGMAKGSPWVLPSSDNRVSLAMNKPAADQ